MVLMLTFAIGQACLEKALFYVPRKDLSLNGKREWHKVKDITE